MSDAISTRTLCAVFSDMRDAHKKRNYSYLGGLIEEAQYRANRMENRLEMMGSVDVLEKRRIKLQDVVRKLRSEIADVDPTHDDAQASMWDEDEHD